MSDRNEHRSAAVIRTVNVPGGVARQFNVQCQNPQGHSWERYASFTARESAEMCVERLTREGRLARMIQFACSPTAA